MIQEGEVDREGRSSYRREKFIEEGEDGETEAEER